MAGNQNNNQNQGPLQSHDPNAAQQQAQGQQIAAQQDQSQQQQGQQQNQQTQQQTDGQGNVSFTPVPEAAPINVQVEKAPDAQPEYGGEAIRRIEQQPQPESAGEKQPQPKAPVAPAPKPQQKPKPKTPEKKGPKIFGYKVSPQMMNNPQSVATQKGKGDPEEAKTWLYVFLDRLLKKQSQEN